MRPITLLMITSFLLTHGSGCSRMLARDPGNRPALEADVGKTVVIYMKSREYVKGTLVRVDDHEIVVDVEGDSTAVAIEEIREFAVHGGIDQDQTVFSAITLTLIGTLVGFLAWMWSGFTGFS